jgi:hypothetical protein
LRSAGKIRLTVKKKHVLKRVLIILAALVLVLVAGIIVIDNMARNRIAKQLKALEPKAHITWSALHTNIFRGTLSLDHLSILLRPDSTEKHQHAFTIKHLFVSGLNYFKLTSKTIAINSIVIDSSNIDLDRYLLDKKDSTSYLDSAKMPMENISVRRIELLRSHVSVHSGKLNEFDAAGYMIIEDASIQKKNEPSFGNIHGDLVNIGYVIPHALHSVHIKKIAVDSRKDEIRLEALKIIPAYSKFELGKKLGRQADHIDASVTAITITKPDFKQLQQQHLTAEKILVSGCRAHIFRDRRLQRRLKTQELPVQFLKSIPYDIHVNSCHVSNAEVVYEEFPAEGDKSGILRIEKLNTSLTPLINHPHKDDPGHMNMHVKGSIMGSGSVEGTIYMPLNSTENYRVKGMISNLDLTSLNSSAENLGLYHIESGLLDMLDFNFTMNEQKAEGKIVGKYHNLVIKKLELDKKEKKNVAHFRSFMIKLLIVPKNKDKSLPEKKRTGKVDFTRDPTRFVSNYLLQSLLTGIKSSFALGFLIPK